MGWETTFDTGNGHRIVMNGLYGQGKFKDATGTVGPLTVDFGDYGQNITGASLDKLGLGDLRLSGVNTFGTVTINGGGALVLANAGAVGGVTPISLSHGTLRSEVAMTLT